ncbi:MAG: hypothetical protein U0U69_12860 [Acidimicrobiia bacterium]
MEDIDADATAETASAQDVDGSEQPPTPEPPPAAPPAPARRGPGAGVWAALAVGVVILVVAAAAIGYYAGRGTGTDHETGGGDDRSAVAGDTARTDQKVCTELLGALREITGSEGVTAAPMQAVMRSHLAGLLSDAPSSPTTASVEDVYDAVTELAGASNPADIVALRSAYEEKLVIAEYQCNKIATWDWPGT